MTNVKHPELEALKRRLEMQAENLQFQVQETKKQLESVITTLDLLKSDESIGPTFLQAINMVSPNDLRGLTQLDALMKIAKANSNRLKLTVAKDLLLRASVTKSRKNANNIIFNVIKRSGRFKKIAPGEYELNQPGASSAAPKASDVEGKPLQ